MKYILLSLAFLIAVPVAAEQVKDGFKGYEWGTNISDFDSTFEITELKNFAEAGSRMYMVNIDSLAGVGINACLFNFFEDEFFYVVLTFEGRNNHSKMLSALKVAYGSPECVNQQCYWQTVKTGRSLKYVKFEEKNTLTFYSKKHMTKWNKAKEKADNKEAEKGAKDF